MQFFTTTAAILAVALPLTSAGNAPTTTGNDQASGYLATLPQNALGVTGTVKIGAGQGGNGILVQVAIANLPDYGGPFLYHVHMNPVTNGNCSSTGGHLDTYGNGGTGCDLSNPASCEVGDLSGKHGKINGTTFSANYIDEYLSLDNGGAAVKGRSIVVHFGNKTAITCANLVSTGKTTITTDGSPLPSGYTMTSISNATAISATLFPGEDSTSEAPSSETTETSPPETTDAPAETSTTKNAASETTEVVATQTVDGKGGVVGAGVAAGVVGLAAFFL